MSLAAKINRPEPGDALSTAPLFLGPNAMDGKWKGDGRIRDFRGMAAIPASRAEDWIGSTVHKSTSDVDGLSRLNDGRFVRDVIEADPLGWLGADHVARFDVNTGLLVKLLDAGERLPLHVHPSREFMADEGGHYGKNEAWMILEAAPGAEVAMGFSREVTSDELGRWVATQDTSALLAATTRLPVQTGDVVFCPAGVPHAIGAGTFLIEVEEPADLSVMLEWKGYAVDGLATGHLGLGYARALECVDRSEWSLRRLESLAAPRAELAEVREGVTRILNPLADPFFEAEKISGRASLDQSFSILIVTDGTGELTMSGSAPVEITRGQTLVIPFDAGEGLIDGTAEIVRLLPSSH